MKIGIMGGTFNPIHNGHLLIAENAHDQFDLDEVWFMPAGIPPHKQNMGILDKEIRCELILQAIKDVTYFSLERREVDDAKISYTYLTLTDLKDEYPENEFYFIMGADSLAYFDKWKKPDIILEKAAILVAVRDELDTENVNDKIEQIKKIYNGNIFPIVTPNFCVSSAEIRRRIETGRSIRFLVPEAVQKIIKEQNLYIN